MEKRDFSVEGLAEMDVRQLIEMRTELLDQFAMTMVQQQGENQFIPAVAKAILDEISIKLRRISAAMNASRQLVDVSVVGRIVYQEQAEFLSEMKLDENEIPF